MNKKITITIPNKEIEGFREPALTAESKDICPKTVEDPAIITIRITVIVIIVGIIIEDGTIITVVNKEGTTRITGTLTFLRNNNSNNNRIIIIRLTTYKQIILNQK